MSKLTIAVLLVFFCAPVPVHAQSPPPFIQTGIGDIRNFLEQCPTTDPAYAHITHDFALYLEGSPDTTPITCTEPISSLPIDQLTDELIALQVMRTAYYMGMGTAGYLPWTPKGLYAWMTGNVAGVNFKMAAGQLYCCDSINGRLYISDSLLDASTRNDNRTWIGISDTLNYFAHEIRHADPGSPGHTNGCPAFPLPTDPLGCDFTYDLQNLGAYGVQYWLESKWALAYLNIGIGCAPPDIAMNYATWNTNAANQFITRFVTNPPPMVVATQPYGGPCKKRRGQVTSQ